MNETVEPGESSLDELVSAVLDGEATASEHARVLADPTAVARLEELRALRHRLLETATAAPRPDGVDPVAMALEEGRLTGQGAGGTADVRVLQASPMPAPRRRGRAFAVAASLAAAAVAVIAGIGVASRESPSDLAGGAATEESGDAARTEAPEDVEADARASTAAAVPPEAQEGIASAPARPAPSAPSQDATGGDASPAEVPDLGGARDAAQLLDRYRDTATRSAGSAGGAAGDLEADEGTALDRTARTSCGAEALATGTIAERRVIVVRSAGGPVVVDAVTCRPVGD